MTEFSQLVRSRLAAQASAGDHPDPDVLAAFAEHRLSGAERNLALAHLSACADCREVVALSAATAPELEPAHAAAPDRHRSLMAWRFALIGSLAVLAVSATVLLRMERPEPEFTIAEVKPAVPSAPLPPPDQSGSAADRIQLDGGTNPRTSRPKMERPASPAAAPAISNGTIASLQSNGLGAGASASAGRNDTNNAFAVSQPAVTAEARSQALPLAPPPPPPQQNSARQAPRPTDAVEELKTSPAQQQQQMAGRGVAQQQASPSPQEQSQPAVQQQQNAIVAGVTGQKAESAAGGAAAAKTSARNESHQTTQPSRETDMLRAYEGAPNPPAEKARLLDDSALHWNITAEGKLERSTSVGPEGPVWQPVEIPQATKFRVVNANGADVWAGGNNATLFHSGDRGDHWTRIFPAAGDRKLEGDITTLRVAGAADQIVRVRTSTGQSWLSGDAGKSWKLETK